MNELTKEKLVLVGCDFVENPGHEGLSTLLKGKQSTSPTPIYHQPPRNLTLLSHFLICCVTLAKFCFLLG